MSAKIITVDFRSDTLFAVERDDGLFLAVKPICETLGIAWQKQLERLKRDPILCEGITVTVIPSVGGPQETTLLRLDLVHGWLFTIDESRVKDEETRQRILAYKKECYATLFRHFYGKAQQVHVGEIIEPPPNAEEAEGPRVRLVTEARHTFGVQSAAQLWFKLGLPVVPAMYKDPRQFEFLYSPGTRNNGDGKAA